MERDVIKAQMVTRAVTLFSFFRMRWVFLTLDAIYVYV